MRGRDVAGSLTGRSGRVRASTASSLLLGVLTLTACAPPLVVCPTIGFVYAAPVVVEISADLLGGGTVSACIGGEDCEPAPVSPGRDGRWEVPQESPYAPEDTIGLNVDSRIRIVITDGAGEVIRDKWMRIPSTGTTRGRCPGPIEFQPVVVS